jgi:DNA polymerase III alpha subunit (gram-positive type)
MLALLFDTETNGLIDNRALRLDMQPEIFEWYSCLVDLRTDTLIEELEFMCKPRRKLLKEVIKVTGVTDDMLKDQLPFSHYAPAVREALAKPECTIGHNINHDVECTEIEFERLGQRIEWRQKICTVEATIHMKGFRLKLAQLYAELFNGEAFADAHRAKNDVMALRRIAVELYRREMI